jgi:hypothetical protein
MCGLHRLRTDGRNIFTSRVAASTGLAVGHLSKRAELSQLLQSLRTEAGKNNPPLYINIRQQD